MNELNTTNNNFLKAIKSWVQPEVARIEYRLYYDNNGVPISMTSSDHPNGQYIVISKEQYEKANYNIRVVNGAIKEIDTIDRFTLQLEKKLHGTPTVTGHAGLVLEPLDYYNSIEYYGQRNN